MVRAAAGLPDVEVALHPQIPGTDITALAFPICAQVARNHRSGRVLLVGDAAHVTNTVIQVAAAAGIAATGTIFTTVVAYSGDIDLAARNALWYAVGAFEVGLALSFTLPAPHPARQNAVA